MNGVFTARDFWIPYLTLDPGNLREQDFAAQRRHLVTEFVVREDHGDYEYGGKKTHYTRDCVEFDFSCGVRFFLRLEYCSNAHLIDQTLYLIDGQSGEKGQMGWWDMARWHPYCLRLKELDLMLAHWTQFDPRWPTVEVPTLLLAKFVGLCDKVECDSLAARLTEAWGKLGLGDVQRGEESALALDMKDEDGYQWLEDPELGWVFHSDEYPCYSIRNRPHANGREGRFPFASFREMMAGVSQRLEN